MRKRRVYSRYTGVCRGLSHHDACEVLMVGPTLNAAPCQLKLCGRVSLQNFTGDALRQADILQPQPPSLVSGMFFIGHQSAMSHPVSGRG